MGRLGDLESCLKSQEKTAVPEAMINQLVSPVCRTHVKSTRVLGHPFQQHA